MKGGYNQANKPRSSEQVRKEKIRTEKSVKNASLETKRRPKSNGQKVRRRKSVKRPSKCETAGYSRCCLELRSKPDEQSKRENIMHIRARVSKITISWYCQISHIARVYCVEELKRMFWDLEVEELEDNDQQSQIDRVNDYNIIMDEFEHLMVEADKERFENEIMAEVQKDFENRITKQITEILDTWDIFQ